MSFNYEQWKLNVKGPMDKFLEGSNVDSWDDLFEEDFKQVEFEFFTNNEWSTVKGDPRNYGYKFVIWDPFSIGSLVGVESEKPVRNIKWV
tara:strand:- start:6593 stop:6862 length:270 start_codon:yes stop_codon:yes gene_type:complete